MKATAIRVCGDRVPDADLCVDVTSLTQVSRLSHDERQPFQQKVLGKLDIHMKSNEVGPYHPC